jgi:hypothetical protein
MIIALFLGKFPIKLEPITDFQSQTTSEIITQLCSSKIFNQSLIAFVWYSKSVNNQPVKLSGVSKSLFLPFKKYSFKSLI